MSTVSARKKAPSWFPRFWAVVRYEMLWNIRKKKFLGILIAAFVIATLLLVVPPAISAYNGVKIAKNPDYAITFGGSGFLFLLFAIATAVNSISSEFESGSIVPLVTKPVSRTMIFLGKVFGSFIILVVSYVVLYGYVTVASVVLYCPQNSLQYIPLIVIGSLLSTFIWVSLLFAVGSISKNTIMTVIVAIILFLALFFTGPIVSLYSQPSPTLDYVPGTGSTGMLMITNSTSVSGGTDNTGTNLVNYALYPNANVTYYKYNLTATINARGSSGLQIEGVLYTESTGLVALRSAVVAVVYTAAFFIIAWVAFKRSQILE